MSQDFVLGYLGCIPFDAFDREDIAADDFCTQAVEHLGKGSADPAQADNAHRAVMNQL